MTEATRNSEQTRRAFSNSVENSATCSSQRSTNCEYPDATQRQMTRISQREYGMDRRSQQVARCGARRRKGKQIHQASTGTPSIEHTSTQARETGASAGADAMERGEIRRACCRVMPRSLRATRCAMRAWLKRSSAAAGNTDRQPDTEQSQLEARRRAASRQLRSMQSIGYTPQEHSSAQTSAVCRRCPNQPHANRWTAQQFGLKQSSEPSPAGAC